VFQQMEYIDYTRDEGTKETVTALFSLKSKKQGTKTQVAAVCISRMNQSLRFHSLHGTPFASQIESLSHPFERPAFVIQYWSAASSGIRWRDESSSRWHIDAVNGEACENDADA
jgi:hypothetical protein